jgi:hypothetical protein
MNVRTMAKYLAEKRTTHVGAKVRNPELHDLEAEREREKSFYRTKSLTMSNEAKPETSIRTLLLFGLYPLL